MPILYSVRGQTETRVGTALNNNGLNKENMSPIKLYIDRLELAYERNPEFESKLHGSPRQHGEDDAFGWAIDIEKTMKPITTLPSTRPTSAPPISSNEPVILDNAAVESLLDDIDSIPPIPCDNDDVGDSVSIGKWCFVRGKFIGPNTAYKYNYRVEHDGMVFGYLYYETYLLRREKIYLRLVNYILYNEDYWQLLQDFENDCGLKFVHISKVDVALDTTVDTSKVVYNMMKSQKSIEWIVNGHRVINRDITVKKLFWVTSGSLNEPDKNRTLYVTQTEGLELCCYDKTTEIDEKSFKYYQTGDWDYEEDDIVEGDIIYRNETRLTRKNIISYLEGHHINDHQFRDLLQNMETRLEIFRNICRKLIRWNKDGRSQDIMSLVTTHYSSETAKCC